MAPLIAIHSAVDLARLRCLLDLCSAFRQQIKEDGATARVLPPEALLVCLPGICRPHLAMALQARRAGGRLAPTARAAEPGYIRAAVACWSVIPHTYLGGILVSPCGFSRTPKTSAIWRFLRRRFARRWVHLGCSCLQARPRWSCC